MKIGIMTFWWAEDNYGQLLQCYALQKYLRDLGHDAFLIRYNAGKELTSLSNKNRWKKLYKVFNPITFYRFIICSINGKKSISERKANPRYFSDFRNKYIVQSVKEYVTFQELSKNPPQADIYIVGSDQVWNPDCFGGIKNLLYKAYFLDFGKNGIRKVSYAASWGRTELLEKEVQAISPLLKGFDFVSVREKSGIELCKQCGYENAKWVCDPTILLSAEKYRELYRAENIAKQEKPYLLLYMLSNRCEFDIQKVFAFAKSKNLEVVYVTGNGVIDKYKKVFATIPQWLSLVDNAEYVITNSFHCCVFSILFNKQFVAIPLTKSKGANSRIDSLCEMFGIENRFMNNMDFSVLEKSYSAKKGLLIEESARFLQNSITGSK